MNPMSDIQDYLFLLWGNLSFDEMQERIDWLRDNLLAGDDWVFCSERKTLVLKNESSAFLYKIRWFEVGKQQLV